MKKIHLLLLLFFVVLIFKACTAEEPPLQVDCDIDGITLEVLRQADTDCASHNGLIEVGASGGTGNYSFKIGTGSFQPDPIFRDLAAGSYQITAKDENDCEATAAVVISNIAGINIQVTTQEAGCGTSLGKITVEPSGGAPPYLFKLETGDFQESNVFADLPQGTFTVVAKDAAGCETRQTVAVKSGIGYAATIAPIIKNNCAVSGCHNGTQFPDFREFKNIHDNADRIKTQVVSRNMPQNGSLSQEQIDAIACWVDDGAIGD